MTGFFGLGVSMDTPPSHIAPPVFTSMLWFLYRVFYVYYLEYLDVHFAQLNPVLLIALLLQISTCFWDPCFVPFLPLQLSIEKKK